MALSDRWTRVQLRTAVRRELMDPNGKWWTDAELNQSISDWQDELQQTFEFVWGTCTLVGTTGTYTLSALSPQPLRLDAVYWQEPTVSESRLIPQTKQELDTRFREWRYLVAATPKVVVQADALSFQFVPPPKVAGTAVLEYPVKLSFLTDYSVMSVPPWTRYSVVPYCCYRAYRRLGPNQDLKRAAIYKTRAAEVRSQIKTSYAGYFPGHYPALRPASNYEQRLLLPQFGGITNLPGIISGTTLLKLIVTGAIDGSNRVYNLSIVPSVLQVFLNGNLLNENDDYTLSGSVVTLFDAPDTGDKLVAFGG